MYITDGLIKKNNFAIVVIMQKQKKKPNKYSKIIVGLQGMDTRNPPFERRTTDSGVFQTPEVSGWLEIMSYMILIFYTGIVLPVVMSVEDWLKKHINKQVKKINTFQELVNWFTD